MNIILSIIVFCLVFFLYLHVFHHLKVSNDLEIYTIDGISKDKLEEICDLRQPVLFKFENNSVHFTRDSLVRNAMTLFKKDKDSKYFSDHNSDFLQETGIKKMLTQNDMFLRPALVSSCNYDIQTGSIDCWTPLQYELNYRNYVYVSEGTITLKIIPPVYSKYLYEVKDYNNFEFRSPINPWNVQEKYLRNYSKIKFLEFNLNAGDILYIPAYWWFSIKYTKPSLIIWFKYCTYMNTVAILPHICISTLQKQNTKFDIADKLF